MWLPLGALFLFFTYQKTLTLLWSIWYRPMSTLSEVKKMSKKKSPEEILSAIQKAVEEDRIKFASDAVSASLDPEIQLIYRVIRLIESGELPKRAIWCSDESYVGDVVLFSDNSEDTLSRASAQLGITLNAGDKFVDAALRLRSKRLEEGKKS
jgi:hypothetical protein